MPKKHSNNKYNRGRPVNLNQIFHDIRIPGGIRIIDISYAAYEVREPNFSTTLCHCEFKKCCHLHNHDFDEKRDIIIEEDEPVMGG